MITRRDSLGMAAKDHTEKILASNNDGTLRDSISSTKLKSLQNSEIETQGVRSSREFVIDQRNVYQEGTFNK